MTTLAQMAEPEHPLLIGDPAPALQTGRWLKGEPVTGFETGKVYVVTFWTVQRSECMMALGALTHLQEVYGSRGLVVIAQDCLEPNDQTVQPFVERLGTNINFRVALDAPGPRGVGKMAQNWFFAAKVHSVPTAFVVDVHGRVAWIGNPLELDAQIVESLLSDKYDLAKATADHRALLEHNEQVRSAALALDKSMRAKDWPGAMKATDQLGTLLTGAQRDGLDLVRFEIYLSSSNYPVAYKLGRSISDGQLTNSLAQNQIAWRIITTGTPEGRDLGLAETCALRAQQAAAAESANARSGVLDTLARVRFLQGRTNEAIQLEQQVLELAAPARKAQIRGALDSYQKGQLPAVR